MEEENKEVCVMCGNDGMLKDTRTDKVFKKLFMANETKELLCQNCFLNNEGLKKLK